MDSITFLDFLSKKNWTDTTYKVVRLDFSEISIFKSETDFENQFLALIASAFKDGAGYNGKPDLLELSQWLGKQSGSSIVLLIDEYDAPLTACLDNAERFEAVQAVMSQFFLKLKSKEGCFRFFFMTGVTKFSHTGIFLDSIICLISRSCLNMARCLGIPRKKLNRTLRLILLAQPKSLGVAKMN